MATAAPVVIMMIIPGVFLAGRDKEKYDAGSLGIDTERPVEHFVFDSGEQIEQLINSLNYRALDRTPISAAIRQRVIHHNEAKIKNERRIKK